MSKDKFMDEGIIALLKSMQEFREAYFNLKKKRLKSIIALLTY